MAFCHEALDKVTKENYAAVQQKMIYLLTTTGSPGFREEVTIMKKEIIFCCK